MADLQIDDKIKYHTGDEKWKSGKIHAIRKVDTGSGQEVLSYLVDTGRDVRVDEYPFDHRDREINKRVNKMVKDGKDPQEAAAEVSEHKDLPKSKLDTEHVRQPEQIDVRPGNIKPA